MDDIIRGWFYFKLTESGNLIGEFSSFNEIVNNAHAADRVNGSGFQGEYRNFWLEGNNRMLMTLNIIEIILHRNRFNLEWRNTDETIIYRGLGTIVDGILIGNYESVQ